MKIILFVIIAALAAGSFWGISALPSHLFFFSAEIAVAESEFPETFSEEVLSEHVYGVTGFDRFSSEDRRHSNGLIALKWPGELTIKTENIYIWADDGRNGPDQLTIAFDSNGYTEGYYIYSIALMLTDPTGNSFNDALQSDGFNLSNYSLTERRWGLSGATDQTRENEFELGGEIQRFHQISRTALLIAVSALAVAAALVVKFIPTRKA